MVDRRPLGQRNYSDFAGRYSARLATQPWNAYYERPATLSLLPDVAGRRLLDAGCGPGVYAKDLRARGAEVVGLDVTPEMLLEAHARLGPDVPLLRANLERPLPFAYATFDIVLSALVVDYVEDWDALFAEFHRVLRPGGTLVFSTGHPASDIEVARRHGDPDTDYFSCTSLVYVWHGWGDPPQPIEFLRRSLEDTLNPLARAGFILDHVLEPKPTELFREREPKDYERLQRSPAFLCLRATKSD